MVENESEAVMEFGIAVAPTRQKNKMSSDAWDQVPDPKMLFSLHI